MNPYALIPVSAAVGIGFLGAVLISQRSREPAVRIFTGYCALGTFLCFVDFQICSAATTHEAAEMWFLARAVWPLALVMLLHFLLLEGKVWTPRRARWLTPLAYVPALVVALLHFRPRALYAGVMRTSFGWTEVRVDNPTYWGAIIWASLIGIAVMGAGAWLWISTRRAPRGRQARIIALGAVMPVLLGTLSDGVLPIFRIYLPPLGSLGTLICAIMISYAVRKLKLFELSPAAAAEGIISSMSDLLFLTDPEGRIQRTNRAALHLLDCREDELLGRQVEEILPQLNDVRTGAVSVKEVDTGVRTKTGRELNLSLSTSAIRDDEGRLLGMSFIGRDVTDRKRAEAVRQLVVRSMIQGQDEERRRIARELHDETGQVLGSLIAELRVLEDQVKGEEAQARLSDLRNLVSMAMQEIQRISRGLHPGVLDTLGLPAALRRYADEFSRLHDIKVTTEILGFDPQKRLAPEVESTLYRVVQEALTNVSRHAEAKEVSVFLVRQQALLRAIIEDDGKGFDSDAAGRATPPRGLGLLGIRERVELLGGSIRLETAPGEGVTLKIELPLDGGP